MTMLSLTQELVVSEARVNKMAIKRKAKPMETEFYTLKNGETAYDIVDSKIKEYWKDNIYTTVVFRVGLSYNGIHYFNYTTVAYPIGNDVEYLYDWWSGELYVKLLGIKALDLVEI